MADTNKAAKIKTPEFRMSFPNLFEPQAMEGGTPKYSVVMLFPKGADLSALKKEANAVCVDKWGADQKKWPKNLRNPFRDATEKEYEGYDEGMFFVTATSKQKPGLVDHNVQPIIDNSEVYPGCYGRATVRAFAYDKAGNRGVSFGLMNVQKTRDGDPLGGRSKPEDDFEAVEGSDTDFDTDGDNDGAEDSAPKKNGIF